MGVISMLSRKRESIYSRIKKCIEQTGCVPYEFEPEPVSEDNTGLRFAPGAKDGIFGHHGAGSPDGTEFLAEFHKLINYPVGKLFSRLENDADFSASAVYRTVLKQILDHSEEYDVNKMFNIARELTTKGTRSETVKFGLALFTLFDLENREEGKIIEDLGLCEEFTCFANMAADCAFQEEHYQRLLFEWAQKLCGWGKIDVIEYMEADTEEKKEWLLCHGCKNAVLYAYLGRICAEKAELYERLKKGGLNDEEFKGACDIFEGLLDEGPCSGISAVEDPVGLTLLFLDEAERHGIDMRIIDIIDQLKQYFEDKDNGAEVLKRTDGIFGSLDIPAILNDNMAEHTSIALRLAKSMDIDVSDRLFELMQNDFPKYYYSCYYLFDKKKYLDEFFALCDEKVNESDYRRGMGRELFLKKEEREKGLIDMDIIVQHLGSYPHKGRKLIRISLFSPMLRWRNIAARALSGWSEDLGKPLKEIDDELYDIVKKLSDTETDKDARERWKKLL